MKALSIKQPWAHLIASGIKGVENRPWSTAFRGRIYVHAGMKKNKGSEAVLAENWIREQLTDAEKCEYMIATQQLGAIIGEVDIVDCVKGHLSRWAGEGQWNFVLANPVLYETPIPCKGQLGFFNVDMPGAETEYSETFRDR